MSATRSFEICPSALRPAGLVALAFAALALAMSSMASAQQSYKTPQEAADALAKAARSGKWNVILHVLGSDSSAILFSGDATADAMMREQFVAAYDAKHQITNEGESRATMVVGYDDFPFPIPLVRKHAQWQFDARAGRDEILVRRVGRNELSAIQACLAYVDAQHEYAEKGIAGPGEHAERIVSRPGKKDGLYWPTRDGEDESPLGELAANATAEAYASWRIRTPYHGYYYKILTRQGPRAPGGALEYRVRGKMIGGFALVAYPAKYRNSGVKTFLVNHQGIVYEKDLGTRTSGIAAAMTSFNPDQTWHRVAGGADATTPR